MPRICCYPICFVALFSLLTSACNTQTDLSKPQPKNPKRCELVDIGEASDAVENNSLVDDQYVLVQGISNPKTLVWKDDQTQTIYYVTKIVGTQKRLFYMAELATGESPKLLAEFTGTMQKWKNLQPTLAKSLQNAFKSQWNTEIDPDMTYLIRGEQKPEGCK